jgi:hypothetical protein
MVSGNNFAALDQPQTGRLRSLAAEGYPQRTWTRCCAGSVRSAGTTLFTPSGPLSKLPDGAVIVASGWALTIARGQAFRWTEQGYEPPQEILRADGLLTPPSNFMALRA